MSKILGLFLVLVLLLWGTPAQAGNLGERLAQFPHWESKPSVSAAESDLIYPDWMEGNWNVSSTLVEQVAPLAPEVVTPGFEGNLRYLNQPINFQVHFQNISYPKSVINDNFLLLKTGNSQLKTSGVVADRAFNGLNIAQAYLGKNNVQAVKVDPNSSNKQITFLRTGRQLISVVTGRNSEKPSSDQFIATEISNQYFRGKAQPYFNEVETTTAYKLIEKPSLKIEADQVTAVYLSPQDADYFKALQRPVALYRYRLELLPVNQ